MKKLFAIITLTLFFNGCITPTYVTLPHNSPIEITLLQRGSANSVGGVDVVVRYKNTSEKTIKYASFRIRAINAVGDAAYCQVRRSAVFNGRNVGPVNPGRSQVARWSNVWYNSTIRDIQVVRVAITFMDDTVITINEDQIVNR